MMSSPSKVLTLNSGSSSLKFAIYEMAQEERRLLTGKVERIGLPGARIEISGEGLESVDENAEIPEHSTAMQWVVHHLTKRGLLDDLAAVGHRVVMGGPLHTQPQSVTPSLLGELKELRRTDPVHLPAALEIIETAQQLYPGLLQVACFDTSFHRTMPKVAQTVALPSALVEEMGLIRYGFHGLSYEYILSELRRIDPAKAEGKVIIAHLGNGASMAALRNGKSLETTMGFTPAGGLVMSSRPGDLDPGVLVHLMTQKKMSGSEWNDLIYKTSGLRGVSNLSSDMQDLEREKDRNPLAEAAITLFCYQARKFIGAFAAVLDGVDTLVFTGGIGEHSAFVRAGICENLSYLGVHLDEEKNLAAAEIISSADSRVTIRAMKTNEELMIARHTAKILESQTPTQSTP